MNQGIIKKELLIDGMSCTSCSMKIERVLKEMNGIKEVQISYSDAKAYVSFDKQEIDINDIKSKIEELGYKVTKEYSSITISNDVKKESKDKIKPITLIGIGIIAFAIFFIIKNTIGFNFIPEVNQSMGYGILFVVGLLTSVHCIAMCGGINLSQCVSNANDNEPIKRKLIPSILYNTGRVISYTVIGGIVGALGSVISLSGTAKGIVAIVAGAFMLIMGLNMMNIFPRLRKIVPRMPKKFTSKIHGAKKGRGPLVVGLLNGFIPCGPLQTMQIYALGTGSFLAGALSMFLFSLGTVPLMFAFGAISSILSSKFTRKLMTVSALLVMFLGIIMIGRGFSQSGISTALAKGDTDNIASVKENVQLVSTEMEPNIYEPLVVQAGVPVRWTINVEEGDLNGCNNPVTIPKYGIQKELVVGENIIEFTPTDEGNIVYTCWMGMISGNISVVSDVAETTEEDIQNIPDNVDEPFVGSRGCSVNFYSEGFRDGKIPTDDVAIAEIKDGTQIVRMDVNQYGFSPAIIVMQKDVETKWIINGEQLDGCNSSLIFPAYEARLDLKQGENITEFTPTQDFYFSCWMGMINGYVKVVDDIDNVDLDQIKEEVEGFVSPSGGGCCG